MKFIMLAIFSALCFPLLAQGGGTTRTQVEKQLSFRYDIEIAGRDTTGRDSVFIVETVLEPINGGWQQRDTYQLLVGAPEAEAFLAQKEAEAAQRATEADRQAQSERQISQAFRDLRMSKVAPLVATRKKELPPKKE